MENTAPRFRIGNEGEAMGAIMSGMIFLADSDAAQLPATVKAGVLKDLERADALETIARAHMMWSLDKERGL